MSDNITPRLALNIASSLIEALQGRAHDKMLNEKLVLLMEDLLSPTVHQSSKEMSVSSFSAWCRHTRTFFLMEEHIRRENSDINSPDLRRGLD